MRGIIPRLQGVSFVHHSRGNEEQARAKEVWLVLIKYIVFLV
jgi:hypothetical protein